MTKPGSHRRGRATRAIIAVMLPASAVAQPGDGPSLSSDPALAKLVAESLAARPEIARAKADVQALRERIPQAGALPDPMVQFGIQNDSLTALEIGHMEGSFVQFMGSQTLPWRGKRPLRTAAAELEARTAEIAIDRIRLATEADVRRNHLGLVLVRERLALLDELETVWQRSASAARSRYETGDGAQSDVLRSQLELSRIRQRRRALQAEQTVRTRALNRLRVHPLDEEIPTSIRLGDAPLPELQDVQASEQEAFAKSPELASARLAVELADKAIALAELGYYPDLTVSAGIMPRGLDLGTMWLLNVSAPIPVFPTKRQEPAIAEARTRREAALAEIASLEQLLRLRVSERRSVLEALLDSLRIYREGLLVQSQVTADSTVAQYAVGKVTFASVLEANAGLISDREGYLEMVAAALRIPIASDEVSLDPVDAAGAAGGGSTAMPGAGAMGGGGARPSAKDAGSPAATGGGAPMSGGM